MATQIDEVLLSAFVPPDFGGGGGGDEQEQQPQNDEWATGDNLGSQASTDASEISNSDVEAQQQDGHEAQGHEHDKDGADGDGNGSGSLQGKLTLRQALLTALNYNLGFSVLVFPYHIARSGAAGFVLLFAGCAGSWLTVGFLAELMRKFPRIRSYSDIGRHAAVTVFGPGSWGEQAVVFGFRVFQLLELLMYMLFSLVGVEDALIALDLGVSHALVMLVTVALFVPVVGAVLWPQVLSRVGLVGTLSFVLCFGLLVTSASVKLSTDGADQEGMRLVPQDFKEFCGAYSGTLLLFAGHAVWPSLFNDLADRGDTVRLVNLTYTLLMLACVSLAALVVVSYGSSAIQELPTGHLEPGSKENILGQVFLIAKLVCVYAPCLYPIVNELSLVILVKWEAVAARRAAKAARSMVVPASPVKASTHPDPEPSLGLRLLVSVAVSIVAVFLASVLPSLEWIVSLTGAVFAVSLALTFPAAAFAASVTTAEYPVRKPLAATILVLGLASSGLSLVSVF